MIYYLIKTVSFSGLLYFKVFITQLHQYKSDSQLKVVSNNQI